MSFGRTNDPWDDITNIDLEKYAPVMAFFSINLAKGQTQFAAATHYAERWHKITGKLDPWQCKFNVGDRVWNSEHGLGRILSEPFKLQASYGRWYFVAWDNPPINRVPTLHAAPADNLVLTTASQLIHEFRKEKQHA